MVEEEEVQRRIHVVKRGRYVYIWYKFRSVESDLKQFRGTLDDIFILRLILAQKKTDDSRQFFETESEGLDRKVRFWNGHE